ncbi:Conserved_hypothetical protein [Hexamita inflata]|uniref:Uncharacterized protein n=1 Tax=Hexamita inflata TaxID=28002 RepID=A0AA86NFP0_9EUKA|nr:Conserved hypothetical protein [Hexamita inflata]
MFCNKAKVLNNVKVDDQIYASENQNNLYIQNEVVHQTTIVVNMVRVSYFAVFGLNGNMQQIKSSLVNVSIQYDVMYGALICMQCQLTLSDSTTVFIASGSELSALVLKSVDSMQIQNSFIQFRISAISASGIITVLEQQQSINILQSVITGYSANQTGCYLIGQITAPVRIVSVNFNLCTNINDITHPNMLHQVEINQVILRNCQRVCITQFLVYGLCIDKLSYGVIDSTNSSLSCIGNFVYNGQLCICKEGYLLNGVTCINIIESILNIQTQFVQADAQIMTNINGLVANITKYQLQIQNEIIGNITAVNEYFDEQLNKSFLLISGVNYSLLLQIDATNKKIVNISNEIQDTMVSTKNQLQLEMQNDFNKLDNFIFKNSSLLNDKISALSISTQAQYVLLDSNVALNTSKLQTNINAVQQKLNSDMQSNFVTLDKRNLDNITILNKQIDDCNKSLTVKQANLNNRIQMLENLICKFIDATYVNGVCVCAYGYKLINFMCIPESCPIGTKLVINKCEPIICQKGTKLVGNNCEVIVCQTGTQLVGNSCQPIICPTGKQLVGNNCEQIVCKTGFQLVGNSCQPINCPVGTKLVGNNCVNNCPPYQYFDGTKCTCGPGLIYQFGTCVQYQCPDSATFIDDKCVCDSSNEVFDEDLQLCRRR